MVLLSNFHKVLFFALQCWDYSDNFPAARTRLDHKKMRSDLCRLRGRRSFDLTTVWFPNTSNEKIPQNEGFPAVSFACLEGSLETTRRTNSQQYYVTHSSTHLQPTAKICFAYKQVIRASKPLRTLKQNELTTTLRNPQFDTPTAYC